MLVWEFGYTAILSVKYSLKRQVVRNRGANKFIVNANFLL